ncbi:MAG TPA: HPF/RaiA family ribosome-associated protein [Candidatus Paceibacterota bacterium]|jgi:ribosome-associated translation inhibitor RaiA|nr:HPF/RaiA family ribosome-associated protein [Candidatus Paceibacterota bacterium]HRZ29886.1 HPF/RaiA family ribosome-associated protein [Candidatus Paceibacterota bacterium]
MENNFTTKNYTLTPSETKVLNKKISYIKNILKKSKGNPFLKIEIEELVKVDNFGNRYRCEANLSVYDKSIYVNKLHSQLRSAMDECFSDLKTQIIKDIKKYKTNIHKNALKNKYSFLDKLLGRKHKTKDIYEDIE